MFLRFEPFSRIHVAKTYFWPHLQHQEDDQIVPDVSTTSRNYGKPRKPHDLETYVRFQVPRNLLKRASLTKSLSTHSYVDFRVSELPGFPGSGGVETSGNAETKWTLCLPDAMIEDYCTIDQELTDSGPVVLVFAEVEIQNGVTISNLSIK